MHNSKTYFRKYLVVFYKAFFFVEVCEVKIIILYYLRKGTVKSNTLALKIGILEFCKKEIYRIFCVNEINAPPFFQLESYLKNNSSNMRLINQKEN